MLLSSLCVVSITLAVMLGPVKIEPFTVWKIALSHIPYIGDFIEPDWSKSQENIIWTIRFPRVLLGAVAGAGLALAGAVIQALLRNPLADPYILGVSSGASVAATTIIIFGGFQIFGQYALSIGAFLGAIVSIVIVYILAQVSGRINSSRLLLSGVAVSMVLSSITNYIVLSAPKEQGMRDAMFWMMGSFSGGKWEHLMIPAIVVAAGLTFLLFQYRALNALLMGEETAKTLGINTDSLRKILIIVISLLTGVIVAVCGSIGFIGLMIPHISRFLIGSDHRRVLPVSALLGALLMIWADVGARLVLAPQEVPVGIITSICGGPFFIWLLRRGNNSLGGGNK
ncbi:FecCD family ABC transporter permease [Brevibacillus daliensis]|uniref:FecCD family ABC transporter permease n=1 Tax=Brevibacillus daliensis TaxID=2892995 RepID=UPI001E35F641|nr:iron ABC transporter permease [Brevibacillus daliensis]